MSTKLALIFSSLILLIIIVGIALSLILNKEDKEDKEEKISKSKTLSTVSPQNTSQNFPAENSRRATQNIAIQLSKSSSINPYITSNNLY
jgi:hypothetical protein